MDLLKLRSNELKGSPMPRRFLLTRFVPLVVAVGLVASMRVEGQTPAAGQTPAKKPPTAAGPAARKPVAGFNPRDLEGSWTFATTTPLERPLDPANRPKAVLTPQEAEARRQAGTVGAYNDFWFERGAVSNQTELIFDPPDGRIPPYTPEGQARFDAYKAARNNDGPEGLTIGERCITQRNSGPPMLSDTYNNNMEIVQNGNIIVLYTEMIHLARMVRIGGQHLPKSLRFVNGDSIGHWEGDTLVVDTTNFRKDSAEFVLGQRGASEDLHLIERFRRVDKDRIDYTFTVDDLRTWTKTWSAREPMQRLDGFVYEYACHEGNVGIAHGMRNDRVREAAAGNARDKK